MRQFNCNKNFRNAHTGLAKILMLLIVGLTWCIFLHAQSDSAKLTKDELTGSSLSSDKDKRLVQMNKVFSSVKSDTVRHKVVLLKSNFKEKYSEDSDFDYNREQGGKNMFVYYLEKLGKFLDRFFGLGKISDARGIVWIIVKILCGLIVLAVLYFVIRLFMNHRGKWFFQKKDEPIVIDINNTEQLIQSADFEQLISEIEAQGDTRQSIRLYYLWLLKSLKDKELIEWLPEKTNADYLLEIKNEALKQRFSYLSYLYNFIWYGEFTISDTDYVNAKTAFLNYLKGDPRNG